MRRSMRWAARCREAFVARPGYALFGIVQGGVHPELRAESAAALTNIGFDGYAIGGLAVGEDRETMFRMLDVSAVAAGGSPPLPDGRRQAGGFDERGGARDRSVRLRAADAFRPYRAAFTRFGPVNLRNARRAEDPRPLDDSIALPGQPRVQPRLPPPSRALGRNSRLNAPQLAQHPLLSASDGRHAPSDRCERLRRFRGGLFPRVRARRCRALVGEQVPAARALTPTLSQWKRPDQGERVTAGRGARCRIAKI